MDSENIVGMRKMGEPNPQPRSHRPSSPIVSWRTPSAMINQLRLRKRPDLLVYMLLMGLFFPLQSLALLGRTNSIYSTVYHGFQYAQIAVIVIAVVLFCLKNMRLDFQFVLLLLFSLTITLSCFVNGYHKFTTLFYSLVTVLGFYIFCRVLVASKGRVIIDASCLLFGMLSAIGALCIVLFPDGVNFAKDKTDAIYFLGGKNSSFFYFWMFLFFDAVRSFRDYGELSSRTLIASFVFVICEMLCDSANGAVVILLTALVFCAIKAGLHVEKVLTGKVLLAVLLLAAFVAYGAQTEFFSWFFYLIGKSPTFTGRAQLWSYASDLIQASPVFGNGPDTVFYFNREVEVTAAQAHSIFFDHAAKYGLLVLAILIAYLLYALRIVSSHKESTVSFICLLFWFSFVLHGLFDYSTLFYVILITVIADEFAEPVTQSVSKATLPLIAESGDVVRGRGIREFCWLFDATNREQRVEGA